MSGNIDISLPRPNAVPRHSTENDTARRLKLEKAARDFESLFVYQLLRTMRASFASSSDDKNEMGFGKDIFMSIADQALAQKVGETGSLGIAKSLMTYLEQSKGQATEAAESQSSKAREIEHREVKREFKSLDTAQPAPIKLKMSYTSPTSDRKLSRDELNSLIDSASQKHGLPSTLLEALIQVESAGDSTAVSRRGAKGLMQLTDSTAKELGVTDVFDPEENVDGGSRYLKKLINRFSGDVKLALAAYNAGPGAVDKYGGIPPYPETEKYVDKVIGFMSDTEK